MFLEIKKLIHVFRERLADRIRPKASPSAPEPRVAEWPPGTSRCEGSPPSAWEPEQDGDG